MGIRGWKKLHLGVDGEGVIVGHRLTDASADDGNVGVDLMGRVPGKIRRVTVAVPMTIVRCITLRLAEARRSLCHRSRLRKPVTVDAVREILSFDAFARWSTAMNEGIWLPPAGPRREHVHALQEDPWRIDCMRVARTGSRSRLDLYATSSTE